MGFDSHGREYLTCEYRRRGILEPAVLHGPEMNTEHPTSAAQHCDPYYKSADVKFVVKLHNLIFETVSERRDKLKEK